MADRILGPLGVKAMENRQLNPETAARLNLFTGSRNADGEVIPDPNGNIIVFPFEENGVTVNEKYRAAGKKFSQKPGGKRTFFNADALDDPSLYNGSLPLVITEGELDCLTAIDCGFPLAVSVPDGAPSPPKEKKADDTEQPDDSSGKFEFLYNNRERLKKIKKFIIAVDNDAPGKHLADEIVRRLSASRCWFVVYPPGTKDLNDVLMRDGHDAAHDVLANAKPYPLRGVYSLKEYPDKPQIQTFSTGWETIDRHFKMFFPAFIVVSGIPNHGKSSWVMHLLVNMAELYGHRAVLFSPEMPIVPQLRDKIRRIVSRSAVDRLSRDELANIDDWINAHFVFIDHDTSSDDDQDLTLEWIMDRVLDAVLRYGIRIFVLDPWNEAEHSKNPSESTTEYINRSLRKLKKFGQRYGLAIIVIAHPTKFILGKDGKTRPPTPYDIDGSAAWANKPDVIAIVHRPAERPGQTQIFIDKIRFEGTGERGQVNMRFDQNTSRYELLDLGPT